MIKTPLKPTSSNDPEAMAKIPFSFLPSEIVRAVHRWGPRSLVSYLIRADNSLKTDKPAILIRVDDFPRWDRDLADFISFDSVVSEYEVPYILGIIPRCEFYPGDPRKITIDEIHCLRNLVRKERVELALHGFTHSRNLFRGVKSEIASYSRAELERRIDDAEAWFRGVDLPFPEAFIPPFNTLTMDNFDILKERFRIVMSGSSSLTTFGKFKPQRCGKTIFLPSYGPLYGLSKQIHSALKSLKKASQPNAVALHWAWESADDFASLRSFLEAVASEFQVWTAKRLLQEVGSKR